MKTRPNSMQLALIEAPSSLDVIEPTDLASTAWSYSRRNALERCPRSYYFDYYGTSKKAALAEVAKDELRILKNVKNRYLRSGDILHESIAWFLRGCQQRTPPDVDQLVRRARDQFAADRSYSIARVDGGAAAITESSPILLQEYLYLRAEADALCANTEANLISALTHFATAPQFRAFHLAASTPGALIERRINFRPDGVPCRVTGQIDLAYGTSETATLVDWKLGMDNGIGDDSLQLGAYALWATDHYGCDYSVIRICKVHLGSGDIVDFSIDASLLDEVRARIIQDAIRMVDIHRYGRDGIAEAFTPCAQPGICRGCSYLKNCPAGRNAIHA